MAIAADFLPDAQAPAPAAPAPAPAAPEPELGPEASTATELEVRATHVLAGGVARLVAIIFARVPGDDPVVEVKRVRCDDQRGPGRVVASARLAPREGGWATLERLMDETIVAALSAEFHAHPGFFADSRVGFRQDDVFLRIGGELFGHESLDVGDEEEEADGPAGSSADSADSVSKHDRPERVARSLLVDANLRRLFRLFLAVRV